MLPRIWKDTWWKKLGFNYLISGSVNFQAQYDVNSTPNHLITDCEVVRSTLKLGSRESLQSTSAADGISIRTNICLATSGAECQKLTSPATSFTWQNGHEVPFTVSVICITLFLASHCWHHWEETASLEDPIFNPAPHFESLLPSVILRTFTILCSPHHIHIQNFFIFQRETLYPLNLNSLFSPLPPASSQVLFIFLIVHSNSRLYT